MAPKGLCLIHWVSVPYRLARQHPASVRHAQTECSLCDKPALKQASKAPFLLPLSFHLAYPLLGLWQLGGMAQGPLAKKPPVVDVEVLSGVSGYIMPGTSTLVLGEHPAPRTLFPVEPPRSLPVLADDLWARGWGLLPLVTALLRRGRVVPVVQSLG